MANQLQLELLKQGVDVWNQWRQHHSAIKPDLREVDLTGVDLSEANLTDAILE